MKIAVVTAAMRSGERGGAEAFYAGLVGALQAAGHDACQLPVTIDESNFEAVLASYARCYDLDVSAFDVVISTKAPTFMVRHPRHVSYLLHTLRVFYDRFEGEYGAGTAAQRQQRAVIHRLDKAGLDPSRVRGHFANGQTTFERLFAADTWWQRIPFTALHHPPSLDTFHPPRPGEYVFMPGRLHRWKRPDLVVRAFKRVKTDVPLLIAGTGEDEQLLRAAAEGDPRIRLLGAISDAELLELYAGALVVPFVPVEEDYGLITIEAFRSEKPVITCTDSGETLQFVKNGITGFVAEPTEQAIADRIQFLVDHQDAAEEMGTRALHAVAHIRWEPIVSTLINAAIGRSHHAMPATPMPHRAKRPRRVSSSPLKVTVLDMQPIAPAVGGGRLRLLGLYHGLGEHLPTTYVGTYDWPGEPYRDHWLTSTLREIDVPLSDRHFATSSVWQRLVGGKTIIDTAFPLLAHHSPAYVEAARAATLDADIVICSHPWIYPLISDLLRNANGPLVVYDSHNVESVLRLTLLGDTHFGRSVVAQATAVERDLCRRADLILACSHEDRRLFHRLYGTPFSKCLVMPNGTFVGEPLDETLRAFKKRALGLPDGPLAVFIGSLYPPNEEAAAFICRELAPALPDVTFAICGGVGGAIDRAALAAAGITNVCVTGVIDDAVRRDYLAASDVAVNPMFAGSGTNIKMFDFMAAALPVISTPTGARGITQSSRPALHICEPSEFVTVLRHMLRDRDHARHLGSAGRQLVSENYAWERLSPKLGRLLTRHRTARRPRPSFTVVVATYERHAYLPRLLACLRDQTFTDFEVIVVDQSSAAWDVPGEYASLDVLYLHTDLKGTSRARNLGAWHARGEVIAFTDDDCEPYPDWLQNARRYFENRTVVGIEGLIVSDKVDDPEYRAVTNLGFEGIGFMTANLLIRRETFNAIDGFDEQFDVPFREDTDLGWRACELGEIPFGHDVRVFHPPHPRSIEREGAAARARLFEKDALLLKKHPDRYKSLFLREGHYLNTEGFREHFMRGAVKYGAAIDEFYAGMLAAQASGLANAVEGR